MREALRLRKKENLPSSPHYDRPRKIFEIENADRYKNERRKQ